MSFMDMMKSKAEAARNLDVPALGDLPRVMLCHLTYGGIQAENFLAVLGTVEIARQLKVPLLYSRWDGATVDMLRSMLASAFLKTNAQVMVMVDHDMGFDPRDIFGLAIKAAETRGLVGALASRRNFGRGFCARIGGPDRSLEIGKDELVEAEHVGAGLLAVHRDALEKMVGELVGHEDDQLRLHEVVVDPGNDPSQRHLFHDFFRGVQLKREDGRFDWLGEDVSFSYRAKKIGIPIHAWLKPFVLHYGYHGFTVVDAVKGLGANDGE